MLDKIGKGLYHSRPGQNPSEHIINIPHEMIHSTPLPLLNPDQTRKQQKIQGLVNDIFYYQPPVFHGQTPPDYNQQDPLEHAVKTRAIICPTNDLVRDVNFLALKSFPGEERLYESSDVLLREDNAKDFGVDFLNTLKGDSSSFPDHQLRLKVGCVIMLLRNLDPSDGHCNGTRYIVRNLNNHTIDAVIATGAFKGKGLLIPRLKFIPGENYAFQFSRTQFPVRLAFGITANKSQGQTYEKIGICLQHGPFFTHGQLYVAMSRVGDPTKVKISLSDENMVGEDAFTTSNVVYKSVLRDAGIL